MADQDNSICGWGFYVVWDNIASVGYLFSFQNIIAGQSYHKILLFIVFGAS